MNAYSHIFVFSGGVMPEDAVISYLKNSGIEANWRQMAAGGVG
ncbi:hypothetical protein ACP_0508 [Acidobacterium capsulatum ATCC 51196]|uniref:Uncharacterized protein n=1 Tax=Acidobacterium capsulatum (strain ATCC 51196 / DSM 11244 / BCRC 80197 / JCM 7670 / NBRC 15755 / NCIMB 13165 / 161) TaxID=240015 RepID=C1F108_ACIC5|nr:hypothetical protein ACP_0508 [Acidobacterium capsulatum ATCC 51196]